MECNLIWSKTEIVNDIEDLICTRNEFKTSRLVFFSQMNGSKLLACETV